MSIERHLGQKSAYKKEYDKSLLVRERRQDNRTYLGLRHGELPFVGFDTWNAYEVSALTFNGLPISFVVKLCYGCTNEWIVESKSLKLYFNSFAMTRLGSNIEEVVAIFIKVAQADLSELLECDVKVNAWSQYDLYKERLSDPLSDMEYYVNLESQYDDIVCKHYSERPELLSQDVNETAAPMEHNWHSSSLVSCCKVTGQPDSGDIFISMFGRHTPSPRALLQYITSFRNENHFHEEICEAIWTRLNSRFVPECLAVGCLYSRRGGIDINPIRVTKGEPMLSSSLGDVSIPHTRIPRQ